MKIQKFLELSPIFVLIERGRNLEKQISQKLEEKDFYFLEALVLASLFFEEEGVQPQAMTKTFKTTKGNMSHCLSGLEGKSLIKRENTKGDQRSFLFKLTDKGKKEALKLIEFFNETQNVLEKELGEEALKKFIQTTHHLEKIIFAR